MRGLSNIIPSPRIEMPDFLSRLEVRALSVAAVITGVALAAIAIYASALAAVLTGAGVLVITSLCLVKKGMNYYAKIERNVVRAQQDLATKLYNSEQELELTKQELEQLDAEIEARWATYQTDSSTAIDQMNEMISSAEQVTLASCQRDASRIQQHARQEHSDRDAERCAEAMIDDISRHAETLLGQDALPGVMEARFDALKEEFINMPPWSRPYQLYVNIINSLMQDTVTLCEERVEEMKSKSREFNEYVNEYMSELNNSVRVLQARTRDRLAVINSGRLVQPRTPVDVPDVEINGRWANIVARAISYIPPLARAKERAFNAHQEWQSHSVPQIQRVRDAREFVDGSREVRDDFIRIPLIRSEVRMERQEQIANEYTELCKISDCLFATEELLKSTAVVEPLMPCRVVSIVEVEEPVEQVVRVPEPDELD